MSYTVYKIECKLTDKIYIGVTKHSPAFRWSKHINAMRQGQNTVLYNAIRKYGTINFNIIPVVVIQDKEDALRIEKELIKTYKTQKPFGYNITSGGDGVCNIDRTYCTGHKNPMHRPEVKLKISGKNHHFYRKTIPAFVKSNKARAAIDVEVLSHLTGTGARGCGCLCVFDHIRIVVGHGDSRIEARQEYIPTYCGHHACIEDMVSGDHTVSSGGDKDGRTAYTGVDLVKSRDH